MTPSLLLIAGAALVALSLGYRAKELRRRATEKLQREQENVQPNLPFEEKTEHEDKHLASVAR